MLFLWQAIGWLSVGFTSAHAASLAYGMWWLGEIDPVPVLVADVFAVSAVAASLTCALLA